MFLTCIEIFLMCIKIFLVKFTSSDLKWPRPLYIYLLSYLVLVCLLLTLSRCLFAGMSLANNSLSKLKKKKHYKSCEICSKYG